MKSLELSYYRRVANRVQKALNEGVPANPSDVRVLLDTLEPVLYPVETGWWPFLKAVCRVWPGMTLTEAVTHWKYAWYAFYYGVPQAPTDEEVQVLMDREPRTPLR